MEIRYATNPEDMKAYTTEKLRDDFLIESLFVKGEVNMVYSHYDRVIVGGVIPTTEGLKLDGGDALRTDYFLERREIGIVNIGGKGKVTVDGEDYPLNKRDCLYVGLGKKDVTFHSDDPSSPAKLYIVSANAHKEYPTQVLPIKEAQPTKLGSDAESNNRTIYKYIHGEGIQSCQLMMGMTLLEPNNMWNTMPAHVHDRRMEVYLYFDMDEESRVFHFMGEPKETRHLLVKNEQAILSPPWSIHSGVGTNNYTFIWAMAGENYTFKDMDFVKMEDLK
ncbi:5-dehydro-4-deoxy-D-glucuronate isomerase [Salipaludibacillus agaradhaerens]|uniref:5-dehydro-4-deoxy-D-glucuronate isomerase n=1 Tax=Salipaludibacillus agaradhaerens TaxID=76935 RepID=UPI002150E45E|nr:5-dehydro-4-deoxy-D-glucuronate isomerase [Salipaludibacillus agaradhaerens]MCR6107761.1 5-dehydro-4-deoxy-D-glucuronate isomerase [Salipaludibacillus agaradhaerens]MCR6119790.1 5-dehydro-4-deoxy-D-glucuronate isomerase [Salipaludibacillus agaradhaerens]UJW58847.1 5-dehydro-4-deoxy-D-glucuronate isomerase [Bacillus sp. A116_S68]